MKRWRLSGSGFTIVELVITIVLIGIVASGLTSLFMTIQRIQVQTAYLESATRAAQRQVESLRNNNYNSLTPGTDINFSANLPTDLPKNRSGIVKVSEPVSGLRRVDVTVTYTDSSGPRSVKLSSLIGVIGIAQ